MTSLIQISLSKGRGDSYHSDVLDSRGGLITSNDFELDGYADFERRIEDDALYSRPKDAGLISNYGVFLHERLFGNGKDLASCLKTQEYNQGAMFEIVLPSWLPELWQVSWEYLRANLTHEAYGLCSGYSIRRIRFGLSKKPPPNPEGSIRVLLIISNPLDVALHYPLDVEAEFNSVKDACRPKGEKKGRIQLKVLDDNCSLDRIKQLVRRFDPHVIHITCHGEMDESNGPTLLLEDIDGNGVWVSTNYLWNAIGAGKNHCLVVLSGCSTGTLNQGGVSSHMATALLEKGMIAVLAMQHPISDVDGNRLAKELYGELGRGRSIEMAVARVREALGDDAGAKRPAWGSPTLYTRAQKDFRLVNPKRAAEFSRVPPPGISGGGIGGVKGYVRPNETYRKLMASIRHSEEHFVLLQGGRGNGKSALVRSAWQRVSSDGYSCLFFDCGGKVSPVNVFLKCLTDFLKECGAPEGLIGSLDSEESPVVSKVSKWASFARTNNFLFLFDGLEFLLNWESGEVDQEEMKEWLDAVLAEDWGTSTFIFTSSHPISQFDRGRWSGRVVDIPVPGLTLSEWMLLTEKMDKRISGADPDSKKQIFEWLDHCPLHLRRLEGYLVKTKLQLKDFLVSEHKYEFERATKDYLLRLVIEMLPDEDKRLLKVLALINEADSDLISSLGFSERALKRLLSLGLVKQIVPSSGSGLGQPYHTM